MNLAIGVDVGGTFTDIIAADVIGHQSWVAKLPTTPADYGEAVVDGVTLVLQRANATASEVSRIIHGTTIATNAVLERRGSKIGLLTTEGFEDTLFIGRQKRSEMYNLFMDAETPGFLCSRDRVRGIAGRISSSGEEIESIDKHAVAAAVDELVDQYQIEALAVSLLFSFANPAHEECVAEAIASRHPGLHVCLSSRIDPRFREYERLVLTAFEAYVRPVVSMYLERLRQRLGLIGITVPLQVMESHGGVIDSRVVEERAVGTLVSGPAAAVLAASELGRLANTNNLIVFDMGGTSTDVSLIPGNRPTLTDQGKIGLFPVRQPMIDVVSIGAGGGSIAFIDAAGLHVGPRSAGAVPGPAAAGRGGDRPTVTDASVVLGYLGGRNLAGGSLRLDATLARTAVVDGVAKPLGMAPVDAARGVHRIVDEAMADAVRLVSVRRGYDPREFTLVACGGAGPMHACSVADKLEIRRILVPVYPGLLAAYGLLVAPIQVQQWQTVKLGTADLDPAKLDATFDALTKSCLERLRRSGGREADAVVARFADLRYKGQSYELTVPVQPSTVTSGTLADLARAFGDLHQRMYGQHDPAGPVELVSVRVSISIPPVGIEIGGRAPSGVPTQRHQRQVLLGGEVSSQTVPVIGRTDVHHVMQGPLIIEQEDCTVIVAPAWTVEPDAHGNLVLSRNEQANQAS
jgi:N-methylhydantoinase A